MSRAKQQRRKTAAVQQVTPVDTDASAVHIPKTATERLSTVIDIEEKIASLQLESINAFRLLQIILDNYLAKGTPCIDHKIEFDMRDGAGPRYIHINLYNKKDKVDMVKITQTPPKNQS